MKIEIVQALTTTILCYNVGWTQMAMSKESEIVLKETEYLLINCSIDEIKELIRERIRQQKQTEQMKNVGIHFMKFRAKWSPQRMSENPNNYASMLNGCAK